MSISMYDAHAHLGSIQEQSVRNEYHIQTMVSTTTAAEWEQAIAFQRESPYILPTFGIHPWMAGQMEVKDCLPYLYQAPVIGEIGMDSVWCDVDLARQEHVFRTQMELASHLRKPVILHTKGEEERIIRLIEPYSIRILVHWYSERFYLEEYIKKGCYFTIGPDFHTNKVLEEIVEKVSLDCLFVETDGIGAVEWALKRRVDPSELPCLLREAMEWIAGKKGVSFEKVATTMERNWVSFLSNKKIKKKSNEFALFL